MSKKALRNYFVLIAVLAVALCGIPGTVLAAPAVKPAVLFVGGVHAQYVAQPLHAQGIEVDVCTVAEMPARLAGGQYNVVVPSDIYEHTQETLVALDQFLARGGGVFLTYWGPPRQGEDAWRQVNVWLESKGIHRRWEVLTETNPANRYTDVMGWPHSWSDQVFSPVNAGVAGVMTLCNGKRPAGFNPAMTSDFSADWTICVKTAPTVQSSPADMVHDALALPYTTKITETKALPLMAVREVGKGRLSMVGISTEWLFHGPEFCPTTAVMLYEGVGGKPSNWLRVFANAFQWLAEPSLRAKMGGTVTPESVLHPPVKQYAPQPPLDWATMPKLGDQPQINGLVGARTALSSGTGSVADYAKAAKAAGLDYIVFLEDSLKMDEEKWKTLVTQCAAVSDDHFGAIPGLTIEDAQGDHLYIIGDNAKLPLPPMVFPDGRLKTVNVSRLDVMFKYITQYLRYRAIVGYWRHKENFLPVADYKLYNSFPVYSFEDGKPIDSAFDDYLYLMGLDGCHALFAFEIMNSPAQVALRAKAGWRLVATTGGDFGDGTYVKTLPMGVTGLRKRWCDSPAWYPPYQYITNGPKILAWSSQNICSIPNGEWWRPDYWEYRAHLHVTTDAPLRSVTIFEGDRGVFRRWQPTGTDFAADLVLTQSQQRDLVLVVEDANGRKAIGMAVWNRNLVMSQFICGDRCNFLGSARLRAPDGSERWIPVGFRANMGVTPSKGAMRTELSLNPAISLTPSAPSLPIDGQPIGFPSPGVEINPQLPGEYNEIFTYPSNYLLSPEISIGQSNYRLAYDPAEKGIVKTPLGHEYENPEKQFLIGKNAWTSWYHLLPTKMVTGWNRIYACNTLDDMRVGWYECHLEMKHSVVFEPNKGVNFVTAAGAWAIYTNGKRVNEAPQDTSGAFGRGTVAMLMNAGGSVVLVGTSDRVQYTCNNRQLTLSYLPAEGQLPEGKTADFSVAWIGASGTIPKAELLETVSKLGITNPGTAGYVPKMRLGNTKDTYLIWHVDGNGQGMAAKLPRTDLGVFLTLEVSGLNDNWDVYLLDHARKAPNYRALPHRDGKAYAELDLTATDADVFVGHPLTCDQPSVKLMVSWQETGMWFIEAHNAVDKPLKTTIKANKEWTLFPFEATIELAPGSSQVWHVAASPERKQ